MIEARVTGGTAALRSLRGFPSRLRMRLDGVMQALGTQLEDRVRDNLGGAVLGRRSGRLAAGISLGVEPSVSGIALSLSVADVPYAAYQEYGFHGTETVRAHLQTVRQAFGRPIAPRVVAVRGYARRVDYPAHSFLRAALDEVAPDAADRIGAAVTDEAAA
jgi:hypothetical protein